MEELASGWLTALMTIAGIAILGIALVYGVLTWQRRDKSPAARQSKDRATERVYAESERDQKRGA